MMSKSSKRFNIFANVFLILTVAACLIPLTLLLISSFTDSNTLIRNGYSFFPKQLSLDAYKYLMHSGRQIMKAYGISSNEAEKYL